jgi:tRNA (guanine37-N1)-methyltransferase
MEPETTHNDTTTTCIKSFDHTQFDRQVQVVGLKIPTQQCQSVVRVLSKHMLRDSKAKPIIDAPDGSKQRKLLLLDPSISPSDLKTIKITTAADDGKNASQTIQQFLSSFHHPTDDDVDDDDDDKSIEIVSHSITLGYDSMSLSEALSHLLPPYITELPSSFETVGHIAHLNLRDELLPWKHIIGQVLLDKNLKIRTVINKTGAIENEWRVLPMEVIAGEDQTVTEIKQHNARFKLDYATVYWNSRLEGEHRRLVDRYFQPGDVILDAMAGIGPFAVPAALKGCTVYANDLNPDSYRWLRENAAVNKVNDKLKAYMLDGREVVRLAAGRKLPPPAVPLVRVKGEMKERQEGEGDGGNELFQHVILNLPATAVEFLDAFNGAFDRKDWKDADLPMVHVYAFLRGDQELKDLQCRAEKALGGSLLVTASGGGGDSDIIINNSKPEFFLVREVAPNKSMYCLSFRVPSAIAFGDSKRQRCR